MQEKDVASVLFTATPDLDAVYPAVAARQLGWTHTALMCVQEMAVPGSLPRCIRVLVHWNTERAIDEIQHVYLHEARRLRPDLASRTVDAAVTLRARHRKEDDVPRFVSRRRRGLFRGGDPAVLWCGGRDRALPHL